MARCSGKYYDASTIVFDEFTYSTIVFPKEWQNHDVPLGTQSNVAAKLYDAALTQWVGWYDDSTMGGIDSTLDRLVKEDPTFSQ